MLREPDSKIRARELHRFGLHLAEQGHVEEAGWVYSSLLSDSDFSSEPELRRRVQADLTALQGQGSFGPRFEILLRNFIREATDTKILLPMLGASFVASLVRFGVMARLSGGTSWYQKAWGLRLAGGGAAYAAEVPVFAGLSRAMQGGGAAPFEKTLASAAITLGALKLSGAATQGLLKKIPPTHFLRSQAARLPIAASQAGMFVGLIAAHRLEERLKLRPEVSDAATVMEVLAAMLCLGMGSHLGRRLAGPQFSGLQQQLDISSVILGQGPIPRVIGPKVASASGVFPLAALERSVQQTWIGDSSFLSHFQNIDSSRAVYWAGVAGLVASLAAYHRWVGFPGSSKQVLHKVLREVRRFDEASLQIYYTHFPAKVDRALQGLQLNLNPKDRLILKDKITSRLKNPGRFSRRYALAVLGKLFDRGLGGRDTLRALVPVVERLGDRDRGVRHEAVRVLVQSVPMNRRHIQELSLLIGKILDQVEMGSLEARDAAIKTIAVIRNTMPKDLPQGDGFPFIPGAVWWEAELLQQVETRRPSTQELVRHMLRTNRDARL